MTKTRFIIFIISLFIPFFVHAQFYVTGDNPGRLKWYSIDTDSYRVIYPEGSDSLARIYAYKLEKYKIPVSRTTGYVTGQGDGRLMPVVMHAYNTSNGSVAWAPKRMDLFTIPSPYEPEPMPWSTMLSIHESRHITQMQFGMTNVQRPLTYVFGEMWNILTAILYPGMYFIEGDAVAVETAFTKSGRGRTADFLNYYRTAFDQGDIRSWDRWLYGSQRHYTPNYYALGYLNLAGVRYLHDCPMFMHEAYERASKQIWDLGAFSTITRKITGKGIIGSFAQVCDTMQTIWRKEAAARAPYIYSEEVSPEPRLYTDYRNNIVIGSDVYSVKSGYLDVPTLVRIDSGGVEHKVSRFAYETGALQYNDGRLYWSESLTDPRWSMKAASKIRYADIGKPRKKNLTKADRLRFNPSFSGGNMADVIYHINGTSSLEITQSGISREYPAPDSLQLIETAWLKDTVYATAVSDGGYGIYALDPCTGRWTTVLSPQPVKIKDFRSIGNELMFTCDRTGVNELYHLEPLGGSLTQKTSTRYGAQNFSYDIAGQYLYFSSQTIKGLKIYRTPVDSLINRPVDFTTLHKYVLADNLARQEEEVARANGSSTAIDENIKVNISQPERYRKLSHAFNLHSWAPVYVSPSNIMNMSFDYAWQAASLGAVGILQNRLSDVVGEFGYSAHKDPYNIEKWRHSGHVKIIYSGMYPVIEATFDINDRAARQYSVRGTIGSDDMIGISISSKALPVPYIEGNIKAYVPLSFSSGGWFKGVIPQVSYKITNDMFNTAMTVLEVSDAPLGNNPFSPYFIGVSKGRNLFRHSLSGSVRGYTMLNTTNSAVYPKWGIGLELGAYGNLESNAYFSPMGYAYLYGYVPGFIDSNGIRLTAMHQTKLSDGSYFGQPVVSMLPRGFADYGGLLQNLSIYNTSLTKVTIDYGAPIYIGDASICGGLLYIKRLVLTPHFDYTFAGKNGLYSAGAELRFDISSVLWLELPIQIGVTYSYNGGTRAYNDFDDLKQATGYRVGHHYIAPTFNITF